MERIEIELKPCPFCGGDADFETKGNLSNHSEVGFDFSIKCSECGIELPGTYYRVTFILGKRGQISTILDGRKRRLKHGTGGLMMDYQEALEKHKKDCRRCRERICGGDSKYFSCLQEIDIKAYEELMQYQQLGALKIVRNAVERRKAKRVLHYGDIEDGEIECPHCHESLWDLKDCGFSNCPYCGQHIDWGEEDD